MPLASGFSRWVCNSPASPILADELHTQRPNPRLGLVIGTLPHANASADSRNGPYVALSASAMPGAQAKPKDLAGEAFSFASIGEAGEKAFAAGADSGNEPAQSIPRVQ